MKISVEPKGAFDGKEQKLSKEIEGIERRKKIRNTLSFVAVIGITALFVYGVHKYKNG